MSTTVVGTTFRRSLHHFHRHDPTRPGSGAGRRRTPREQSCLLVAVPLPRGATRKPEVCLEVDETDAHGELESRRPSHTALAFLARRASRRLSGLPRIAADLETASGQVPSNRRRTTAVTPFPRIPRLQWASPWSRAADRKRVCFSRPLTAVVRWGRVVCGGDAFGVIRSAGAPGIGGAARLQGVVIRVVRSVGGGDRGQNLLDPVVADGAADRVPDR